MTSAALGADKVSYLRFLKYSTSPNWEIRRRISRDSPSVEGRGVMRKCTARLAVDRANDAMQESLVMHRRRRLRRRCGRDQMYARKGLSLHPFRDLRTLEVPNSPVPSRSAPPSDHSSCSHWTHSACTSLERRTSTVICRRHTPTAHPNFRRPSNSRRFALTLSESSVFGAALPARHGGGRVQLPKIGLCSNMTATACLGRTARSE